MKKPCSTCAHFINEVCAKKLKNGYENCAKHKPIRKTIADLEQEKRKAYSTSDIEKATEIQRTLDYFYWGIK